MKKDKTIKDSAFMGQFSESLKKLYDKRHKAGGDAYLEGLEDRVMYQHQFGPRNTRKSRQSSLLWKLTTALSTGLSIFLAYQLTTKSSADFHGPVGQLLVLDVALERKIKAVTYVEVELDSGVSFYAEGAHKPSSTRKLTLAIKTDGTEELRSLPFIIRGNESGMKTVRVTYFGEDKKEIESKKMNVLFNQVGSST